MAAHFQDLLLLLISTICCVVANNYAVPSGFHATVKVFHPKGFEVSIPDASNISLFAFHGKLNDEMEGREAGTWARDIPTAKNGRWTFRDKKAELKLGDTLYYWTTIVFAGLAYYQDDGVFKVEKYENAPSIQPTVTDSPVTFEPVTKQPTNCQASITSVNGQRACSGQLIFDEEFDSEVIDNRKWSREVRIPLDTEDAEFVSFQKNPFNSYIEDGKLHILPSLLMGQQGYSEDSIYTGTLDLTSQCTATRHTNRECVRRASSFYILPPVVSAKLNTRNSFKFRYGRVEIRAKVPKGDWLFPQLYLEPSEYQYGTESFSSGLMRVGFVRGNDVLLTNDLQPIGAEQLCGGVVLSRGSRYRNDWMKCKSGDKLWSDDFHIYGLEWTELSIKLSVDGIYYGGPINYNLKSSAQSRNVSHASGWNDDNLLSPFDREFHISLGVGVGGVADFPDRSLSGVAQYLKPWANTSPKGELNFFRELDKWTTSWSNYNSKMQVDYVRVWAI